MLTKVAQPLVAYWFVEFICDMMHGMLISVAQPNMTQQAQCDMCKVLFTWW